MDSSAKKNQDEEEPSCAKCGIASSEWGGELRQGFVSRSGEIYCCRGCSENTGCTCEAEFKKSA